MTTMTPQELADRLDCYLCRDGAVWYVSQGRPTRKNGHWQVKDARSVGVLWQGVVMYIGTDEDSLAEPKRSEHGL